MARKRALGSLRGSSAILPAGQTLSAATSRADLQDMRTADMLRRLVSLLQISKAQINWKVY